eukprot:COSAG01_NODE_277_length_19582_cov_28.126726_19_plen_196_part_00
MQSLRAAMMDPFKAATVFESELRDAIGKSQSQRPSVAGLGWGATAAVGGKPSRALGELERVGLRTYEQEYTRRLDGSTRALSTSAMTPPPPAAAAAATTAAVAPPPPPPVASPSPSPLPSHVGDADAGSSSATRGRGALSAGADEAASVGVHVYSGATTQLESRWAERVGRLTPGRPGPRWAAVRRPLRPFWRPL